MRAIERGIISDNTEDIYSALLNQPGTFTRYSKHVVPSTAYPLKFVSLLDSADQNALASAAYFSAPGRENDVKMLTHIVCADVETPQGQRLALEALRSLSAEGKEQPTRVAIFGMSESATPTWQALHASASSIGGKNSVHAALALAKEVLAEAPVDDIVAAGERAGISSNTLRALLADRKTLDATHAAQRGFCLRVAKSLVNPAAVIVTNGRVLGLDGTANFTAYDFELLERFESHRASSAQQEIEDIAFEGVDPDMVTSDFRSNALMKAVSLLGVDESQGIRKLSIPPHIEALFEVGAKAESALVTINAVLNPLGKAAQRYAPMFEALAAHLPVRIRIFLNPQGPTETIPLKTFYHYVIEPTLHFDKDGVIDFAPTAVITTLPATRLITLGMDVPHPWIVMASEAKHDLDNIRLGEAEAAGDTSVVAGFRLEHILVEGNCHDENRVPPRGLELQLSTPSGVVVSDTLVMSNFGYFQLKANPGIWLLWIREGRSSLLYGIDGEQSDKKVVVVNSFLGNVVALSVHKRAGFESEPLLVAEEAGEEGEKKDKDNTQQEASKTEEKKSLWERIWGSSKVTEVKEVTEEEEKLESNKANTTMAAAPKEVEKINVFSIASGHLYERFVKIMMTSVKKHASLPVKFWFIKNYLSPKFKETIAGLAEKYGFEYELVTYKWPAWLYPQTEKQRLIWGYKILFLDVLFPINLKKVIYVDADQVVRGDLAELVHMPLDGAPIAITPFCQGEDARQQGYWREHLRGKPYHITALFVVDLARFRRLAAGDQYRAHYDNLARDPNSLANLDQDLPNYLQHVVRIRSLPPEWLWCETWCSDASKPRAKTIDLCNNPMTKTPKLEAATHIIEEWTALDTDVRETEKALQQQQRHDPQQ
jgi:UDP-glucose:glycoprotein glucosyltransferase